MPAATREGLVPWLVASAPHLEPVDPGLRAAQLLARVGDGRDSLQLLLFEYCCERAVGFDESFVSSILTPLDFLRNLSLHRRRSTPARSGLDQRKKQQLKNPVACMKAS